MRPKNNSEWRGCYKQGWGNNLVSEAYSHPAKVSFSLAQRIYEHALEMGWIEKGGICLDPFGGICGFGYWAMIHGLHFIAVELEPKFVKLGQENIDLWNRKLRNWPGLGTAKILQGDSRRIGEVVKEAGIIISSSPYPSGGHHPDQTGAWGGLASHKGFADKGTAGYGDTPGQLGKMREGSIEAVIGSPNYPTDQPCPSQTKAKKDYHAFTRGDGSKRDHEMRTVGNLGSMKEGDINLVLGSPPYAGSIESDKGGIDWEKAGRMDRMRESKNRHSVISNNGPTSYGKSAGQLGSMSEGAFDAVVSSVDKYSPLPYSVRQEVNDGNPKTLSNVSGRDESGRNCLKGGNDLEGNTIKIQESQSEDENLFRSSQIIVQKREKNRKGTKGERSLGMEGRRTNKTLSEGNKKGIMRSLQGEPKPGNSSQGLQPLQRQPDESSDSLPIVPYEHPQESILGSQKERSNSAEIKWADRMGPIDLICSSPPYEESQLSGLDCNPERLMGGPCSKTSHGGGKVIYDRQSSQGNIGCESGDTFWQAAHEIVRGCYDLLRPGGHAIWVTKSYCRAGKIVDFPARWKALCETVGFKTVCEHRAMLVENHGSQINLEGKEEEIKTTRKSFFRRLHENKHPDLAIDWEMVQCMEK